MFDRPRERAFFLAGGRYAAGCFARQSQLLYLILDYLPLNSYRKAGVENISKSGGIRTKMTE